MIKNKIARISLSSGLIGLLFTNPRRAIDNCIESHNNDGWRATFILPHSERNILVFALQILVLLCTLGLWTWGAGYLIMFEKDI